MVLFTQNHFFMFNLNSYLAKEHGNEHVLEHSLSKKKKFLAPKIYSANGDLTKRWYIYFSYRDPNSGKLKRQTPVYANANKYKTKEDRLSVLVTYRKALIKLLKKGYSPYLDVMFRRNFFGLNFSLYVCI